MAEQKEKAVADVDRMKEQANEMERAYRERFEINKAVIAPGDVANTLSPEQNVD